jgi:hypothetical protein
MLEGGPWAKPLRVGVDSFLAGETASGPRDFLTAMKVYLPLAEMGFRLAQGNSAWLAARQAKQTQGGTEAAEWWRRQSTYRYGQLAQQGSASRSVEAMRLVADQHYSHQQRNKQQRRNTRKKRGATSSAIRRSEGGQAVGASKGGEGGERGHEHEEHHAALDQHAEHEELSYELALQYYQAASARGDAEATFMLGMVHRCPLCAIHHTRLHYTHYTLTLYGYGPPHCTHTALTLHSHCTRTVLTLYSCCPHTVLILYSYCTHTVLILYSYCTRTVLALYSYCPRTVLPA